MPQHETFCRLTKEKHSTFHRLCLFCDSGTHSSLSGLQWMVEAEKGLLSYILEDKKDQLWLQTIVKIVIVSPMPRIPVQYSTVQYQCTVVHRVVHIVVNTGCFFLHYYPPKRPIYVNVNSPNLGFPYFNFLGGYQ